MPDGNYFDLASFMEDYKEGRIVVDTKTLSKSTIIPADQFADREFVREQDTILQRELYQKTQGMTRVGEPYMETAESVTFTKARDRRVTFFRTWFQQVQWDHKENVAL